MKQLKLPTQQDLPLLIGALAVYMLDRFIAVGAV